MSEDKKEFKRALYPVEIWNTVNPKYFNLVLKISNSGQLILAATPSYTPGKLPAGVQKGRVPKGTKVFNYEKTIVVGLEFADCFNIVNFIENMDPTDKVEIYRKLQGVFDKSVNLQWNVEGKKINNAVMYFNMTESGNDSKVMIPFGMQILSEFSEVIKSYMNNMPMIKLFCNGVEGEYEKKEYKKSKPSTAVDDEDEEVDY